jgi:hypothetical protein
MTPSAHVAAVLQCNINGYLSQAEACRAGSPDGRGDGQLACRVLNRSLRDVKDLITLHCWRFNLSRY